MNAQAAVATIGHNSVSYREMIEADPKIVFRDADALPGLVTELDEEVAAHQPDLSTKRGRDAIASLARSIVNRKTAIDAAGKEENEAARAQINKIDEVRRSARSSLDTLRDKARDPLTKWEAEQEARDARVTTIMAALESCVLNARNCTLDTIDGSIAWVAGQAFDEHDFEGVIDAAEKLRGKAMEALTSAKAALVQREAERAELARLRAAEEERDRAAREAQQKAAAEVAERERIENAARAAEAAARREAEQKAEAERAALQRQHDAELAAERKKVADAERARQEQEAEAARIKAQAEAEARRIAAEDASRAADHAHRGEIMRAAKEALMEHAGIPEDKAKKAVLAIVAGSVPAVSIRF